VFMSLKSSLFYVRFTIYIFAVNYFLNKNNKIIDNLFFVLSAILFAFLFDSVFQFIFGYNILGYKIDNVDKINSFFR